MADFKRIVEILVQVTGDTGRQIENVANNLKKIDSVVSTLNTNTSAAVKSIESLAGALSKIKDFQAPQLDTFAKDIRTLSNVDAGKLSAIAVSLDTLSKVKFNPAIGTFFAKLSELNKIGDPGKVAALADSLAKFGNVGKLPSLTAFTNNLKELSTVTKLPPLQGFTNQLVTIAGITQLPAIGAFVNNLIKLSSVGTVPDLGKLAKALQDFQSVTKLPDLGPFSVGLASIASVSKPASFAALATSLKRLQEVDVSKMPKAPELLVLANAIRAFTNIGSIPSITKFINSLKQLQNIGSINIPNFSQLVAEVNRLSAAFQNMANVAPIISALGALGVQARQLQQQMANVNTTATQQSDIFSKLFGKIKTYFIYRVIADNMLALKEAFNAGQDAIIDFDQSLKDLQAISGATDLEVQGMAETIKYVASTTKFSASEVAEGMIILAQAGFSAVDASRAMEAVANLATGTLSDMAQTVDLISTTMSIFGVEASRATDVADMLANAINKSKLTVEKLRTAINYVGPVAEDAGISMGEMSAAMMTLANSGLRASTIGTSLRTIIGELIDPSDKLAAAARTAGISLTELDPRVNSLSTVIQNLKLVITDSQDALDIFGKRASSAVLTLANTTTGGYEDMLAAVNKSGTAAAMAAKQMEGLGVAFKNLRDKLALLAIEMGDGGIVQVMRLFVNGARAVVDALLAMSSTGFGKFIMQVAAASTAILAVIFIFTKLGGVLGFVKSGLLATASTMGVVTTAATGATAASIALGTALKAIGIGIIIAGVAAVIDVFTDKAQIAADQTGVLVGKLESLAASNASYSAKIADAAGDVGKTTEANKQLRGELENVAKNSEEFGSALSNAALNAMQSIDGLNFEIRDSGTALEEYRKAIDSVKEAKLKEHFKQQEEAIKESVSFTTKMANRVTSALASMGSSGIGMTEATLFEDVAQQEQKAIEDSKKRRDADAQHMINQLVNKKMMMAAYVEYVRGISDKIDKTDNETKAIDVLNRYTEMAGSAMLRLKEKGFDISNTTIQELLKIAEKYGYIQEAGSATFDALEIKLTEMYKKSTEASKGMVDNWKKDGTDMVTAFSSAVLEVSGGSAELQKSLQDTLNSIDMGVLDEIGKQRQAIIDKQDALDAQYRASGKARDKDYYMQWNALQKEAAKLNSKYIDEDSNAKARAVKEALSAYQKALAQANKVHANNANARAQEEARIEQELQDKLKKIRAGAVADPKVQEDRVKSQRAAAEAAGAAELQAIAELEASKKVSEEQAAKLRVDSEYNTLLAKLKISTDHFNSIKELVDKDSDEWKKANVQKLEDEKAVADFIRKELVDALKKASKAQEELNKLYGENKMGGKLGAEASNHGNIVGKEYKDARKKIEDIELKSANKIADINEKLEDKLEKINDERVKDQKDTVNDIADINRKGAEQIRKINQRGMSDHAKEVDNKKAINNKLFEAENLLAKAKKDNDEAALKSAESLYNEVFGMADELKSKSDAIFNTKRATKGLVDAREVKAAIDELERGKKIADEIADADREKSKTTRDANKEINDIASKYKEAEIAETSRHEKEMADIRAEITEWEKKLAIANQIISATQQAALADPNRAAVNNAKANIVLPDTKSGNNTTQDIQAAKNQFTELKNLVEAGAVVKIDGQGAMTVIEDVKRAVPPEIKTAVTIDTAQVQTAVQDLTRSLAITPVQVLLTVDQSPLQELQGTLASMQEAGISLSVVVDNPDVLKVIVDQIELLQKSESVSVKVEVEGEDRVAALVTLIKELADKFIRVVAEVSGIDKVHELKAAVDALQSKSITITTNYVTNGSPEAHAAGGTVGSVFKKLSNRLITSGSGTKDDVPAMLMRDEFVHRQAAVKKYGVGFMHAVNNLQFPVEMARKFASGGLVSLSNFSDKVVQTFSKGGKVLSSAKRRIEDYIGNNISVDSLNITNKISDAASSIIHPVGQDAIMTMMNGMRSIVSKFASGGSSSSSVISASELAKIRRDYDTQIQIATSTGHASVANILSKEKEDLMKLAATLSTNLRTIEEEYKQKVAARTEQAKTEEEELDISYRDQKAADERSYNEQVAEDNLQYSRSDFDFQRQEAEKVKEFKDSILELQKELPKQLEDYAFELEDAQAEYEEAKKKYLNFRKSRSSYMYSDADIERNPNIPIEDLLRYYYTPRTMQRGVGFLGHGIKITYGKFDEKLYNKALGDYKKEVLRPYLEAERSLKELKEANPQAEFNKSMRELSESFNKDKEDTAISRSRELEDRALSIFQRDRSYKESRMEADLAYKLAKDELKSSVSSDMTSLKDEKDSSMRSANEDNLKGIEEVKAKAADDVSRIKSQAQESISALVNSRKGAIDQGSVTKSSSDSNEVADKIASSRYGMSIDELLKRLSKGILRFNTGGSVPFMKGAIHGKDSILAALTPNEYVMSARAVSTFGSGFFDMLNNLQIPRFNMGGLVNSLDSSSIASKVVHAIDLSFNGAPVGEFSGSPASIDNFIDILHQARMRV
jgi:TP901 family phage tail tape measure protein